MRAQPPWLLPDPESNRFGTKTRASRSESSQTRENGARNAKSREHSLSAFCVNWLTGSFRAKNLSSPGWARTTDTRINSPLLCRLSYRGIDFLVTGNVPIDPLLRMLSNSLAGHAKNSTFLAETWQVQLLNQEASPPIVVQRER